MIVANSIWWIEENDIQEIQCKQMDGSSLEEAVAWYLDLNRFKAEDIFKAELHGALYKTSEKIQRAFNNLKNKDFQFRNMAKSK